MLGMAPGATKASLNANFVTGMSTLDGQSCFNLSLFSKKKYKFPKGSCNASHYKARHPSLLLVILNC